MTREEAIDVLKHNYPSSCYEDLCKAVDMAIKALKQPEIVRCKECKHAPKCYGDVLMRSRGGGYIYCPVEYCSAAERRSDEAN